MTSSLGDTYTVLVESGTTTAVVRSYAKVNLTLDVLGIRPDGYHAIESVMQSISLHDTLTLVLKEEPGISITCDMPGIPTDEKNLVHKAASVLLRSRGICTGLNIHIEKLIPVQAGLGGGSSNAASVLLALDLMFTCDGSLGTLRSMAAGVGSDVPFFMTGGTALVRGRGEEVESLSDIPTQWMVILKPPFGISTPWAYRRLDEMRAMQESSRSAECERNTASQRMVKCIQASDWGTIPGLLSNDLEPPAVEQHPEIGTLKRSLLDAGASGTLMCGSGSAVLGMFRDEDAARSAERSLALPDVKSFVTKTTTRREAADIWIVP